ncbi:major facilitator superfamily transporter [Colletotrichum gloeosporioides Cg-14]|uniref:Major facilitator superfamily transporter n=1 Tax=Colletotrichum gloeosporioides (strain Cg-14) TaxID=1237896 RepID=T0LRY8_COLGC|nr:major facilitator superfamily transporter [Colletotrichum gloeosporioides Cg-14]
MDTHTHRKSVDNEPVEKVDDLGKPIAPIPSNGRGTTVEYTSSTTHALSEVEINLRVIDEAVEAIGFGRFQWQLALSCGFGFLADQMLLVSISLVGPQLIPEFAPKHSTLLPASNYAGLFIGAVLMGLLADNIGRRIVWQLSIFGISVATMLAASSPNWAAINVWVAVCGFFGGGNLAIDLTILAENIPQRWSFMLAGLACVWGLGNTITGIFGWALIVPFSCPQDATPDTCPKSANMGWRYLYILLGGLCLVMSIVRALVLRTHESPRWLVTCGRIDEGVDVINRISAMNNSTYTISADQFIRTGSTEEVKTMSFGENIHRAGRLFKGRTGIRLMICLTMLWMLVGIAYPLFTIFLPYYLRAHGADLGDSSNYTTYRDWTISSVVGIFGPILSTWMVSNKWLRSRKSLVFTGAACAAFAGAFTSVKNPAENLAFSSMVNFWLNAMYAIIYAYTPQALNVENRGLGNGLLMAVGRFASLIAPFIATYSDITTSAPIWVACACFAAIGLIGLVLPVDTVPF